MTEELWARERGTVIEEVPKSINRRQKRAHVVRGQFVLEGEPGLLGSLCRPQLACAPLALRRRVLAARSAPDSADLRVPNCFPISLAGLLVAFAHVRCPASKR
jgi:hypothetical protein